MKYTNNLGLSNAVRDAIIAFAEDYDKVGWRSVTTLIDSPRAQLLVERHADEITEDVSDMIWMFIGNMGHLIAERSAGKNCIAEQRFIEEVAGKQISFKPDRLERDPNTVPQTWTLRDFKLTSVYILKAGLKGDVKVEWERQMNLYVYLLELAGFKVSEIKLEIIGRDWRFSESRLQYDYPKTQCGVVDVPVWTRQKQEDLIMERIKLYKEAELLSDDELPECSEDERWADPDRWAVVKKNSMKSKSTGYKRSLPKAAKFLSRTEAMKFIDDMRKPKFTAKKPKPETIAKAHEDAAKAIEAVEIEFRKGESKRCERGYCKAAPFCNQFKEKIKPIF